MNKRTVLVAAVVVLAVAACTPKQIQAVEAEYAARMSAAPAPVAQPTNSVDLPRAAEVQPEIRTANVDVTADCKFLTYTIRVDPGSRIYIDKDGGAPSGFLMDASGSRTVAAPIGFSSAMHGYDWTIDRSFPDRFGTYERIAAGHVNCP